MTQFVGMETHCSGYAEISGMYMLCVSIRPLGDKTIIFFFFPFLIDNTGRFGDPCIVYGGINS